MRRCRRERARRRRQFSQCSLEGQSEFEHFAVGAGRTIEFERHRQSTRRQSGRQHEARESCSAAWGDVAGHGLIERHAPSPHLKDRPGEFVISTNPALAAVLKSGYMPCYGYGAGVVRLAIGDDWESGGPNRSSNGEFLLFLPGATLTAATKTLINAGALSLK